VIAANGNVIFRSAEIVDSETARIAATSVDRTASLPSNIYLEKLSRPLRLFVLGAGDDAKPVVTLAVLLGWDVVVADARPQLARKDRFPQASEVLATNSALNLGVASSDAVVIMTHSYEQDRALLTGLLGTSDVPGYIGLLGAAHRSSLIISEAAAALGCTVAECCERVWAPVGLDLGGDGAEAIALAVVAEVQAWRQGKLAASRRLTQEHIAEQIARGGASRYLQTQCAIGS
jgi:xanthine/CO dehydrogenase XdhC/CoxF family maturation factor